MTPILVQRAKFYERQNASGIDSILSFDYMGSAEFEYGALPRSLKAIRAQLDQYDYFALEIQGKCFTVFCKASEKARVFDVINGLANDVFRLKEYCDIHRYVTNDTFIPSRSDHWWDIINNWMVWKEDDLFTEKFKKAISTS